MISNRHCFVQTSHVSSTTEKLQQSLSSHLIKMKASFSLISATAAIVSVANGFADCNAGITYNFGATAMANAKFGDEQTFSPTRAT
jgi:hypothetical protein